MMKIMGSSLSLLACASLLAVTAIAGETAKAPAAKAAAAKAAGTAAWPSETLSGKIAMVDTAAKVLVIKGSDGVPFDMHLTSSTRISSGGHRLTLNDLNRDKQKNVTVRFVPERNGDIARSIQVNG